MRRYGYRFVVWLMVVAAPLLQGCGKHKTPIQKNLSERFEISEFAHLAHWQQADFSDSAEALRRSCASLKRAGRRAVGDSVLAISPKDWRDICRQAESLNDTDMQIFLETHFTPLRLREKAFLTGYFEAHLNVSKHRDDTYRYAVPAAPQEQTTATAATEGSLQYALAAQSGYPLEILPPTYDRKRIESQAESGKFSILFWSDSNIDLFLAQIQGSAKVTFPDGSQKRIGFAQHNNHPYRSIGQYLLDSGRVQSLPHGWFSIREYLENNPNEATAIMHHNPRYIFFRVYHKGEGPYGRFKTPLIADRSMAADAELMPFGAPVWISHVTDNAIAPRLMFIHDTGAAIKGFARADIFFGHGKKALSSAALLRHRGKLYILVPNAYLKRHTELTL